MWLPVLEIEKLTTTPVRVNYWGSPVVLFRTAQGKIGALEDQCGHRSVPLSCGKVIGDSIRCGYHHFAFDQTGQCREIPAVFGTDLKFQASCSVRRFYLREALGLIWISIEDETAAPFPIDVDEIPADTNFSTGTIEVKGDVRVWMDHYLDAAHALWVHPQSVYGGSADEPAKVESMAFAITPESRYPVIGAASITLAQVGESNFWKSSFQTNGPVWRFGVLLAAFAQLRRLFKPARQGSNRPRRIEVRGDLVTPLCQRTIVQFKKYYVEYLTSVNPIAENLNQFVFTAYVRPGAISSLNRYLHRYYLRQYVERHLGLEDHQFLMDTPFHDDQRFRRTPLDETVTAMRAMFINYVQEKAHLYPPDSLIHKFNCPPDRSLPRETSQQITEMVSV